MNKKILNLSKLLLTVAFALSILACAFSLNFASADTSVSIYDGGSIRYDEYEGIRFTAYVADSLFDDPAIKDLKDGVTVGMYVVPSTLAGNVEEIDESTSGVKTVSTSSDSFVWQGESDKDGYQQYNVVIYGIPSSDYNTQILARAFVDNNGEKDLSATVSRSITNVANATLAGDTLVAEDDDYKLTDTQIEKLNKYVSATETLTDVVIGRIVDGVAKWDAVEGALGYIVKTDKDMFKTTDTQVDLNGATEVSVVAYGDGASKTYSVVDSATVHELGDMELATFNDESYIHDLEAGNHTIGNYNFSEIHHSTVSNSFYDKGAFYSADTATYNVSEPVFVNGISSFNIALTGVRSATCRLAYFSVYLQKSLDVDVHAGIRVRIKYGGYNHDVTETNKTYTLRLANPTPADVSTKNNAFVEGYYHTADAGYTFDGGQTAVNIGEWIDWYIPAEKVNTFYNKGDTKLVFALATTGGFSHTLYYTVNFEIDHIGYYDVMRPTNVALNGTTLSWDAVDGATAYVIDVNGTTVNASTNSYDLSSVLTADSVIKVKAVQGENSSDYSESVYYYALENNSIATFDSALYENSVKLAWENTVQPTGLGDYLESFNARNYTRKYLEEVEGATNGVLHIMPVITRYSGSGSARHALFTVKLPKALSGFDNGINAGITIKFQIVNVSAYHGAAVDTQPTSCLLSLVGNETVTGGHTYYGKTGTTSTDPYKADIALGTWVTWNITAAQLSALGYVDGSTEISFVVASSQGYNNFGTYCYNVYLDQISYVPV